MSLIEKLKKNGKLWLALGGVVLGIILLLTGTGGSESKADPADDAVALAEYSKEVEEKIYELCSCVKGVSDVSVAVSLERGYEYVYAQNDTKGNLIVVGSGSSKSAVKVTEKPPVIGGIGVVCRGGGDPAIQKKLIELLSAAFGVKSNKIYIAEAKK